MSQARCAEIYGVTLLTVARWVAAGKRAGKPCPMESPDLMPEWYQDMIAAGEFMKGIPQKILEAAARASVGLAKLEIEPVEVVAFDAPEEIGKPIDYAASLELAERNVGVVRDMFARAQASGNDQMIIALQRTLNDALDSHRALMRDRGKIQAEAGETLPKAEVRQALLEIHGNVTKRFRQGLKSAFADVPDHAETMETWGVWVDSLVDSICQGMRETEFAAPIEP